MRVMEGGVWAELSTVKEEVVPCTPGVAFFGLIRIRTAFAGPPSPTPSIREFHTKVWPIPGLAEQERPVVPSPPGPPVAGWNVAPPSVENSTVIIAVVPKESDNVYWRGTRPP